MRLLRLTVPGKVKVWTQQILLETFVGGMPTPLAGQIFLIRRSYCELPCLSDSSLDHTTSDNN
jgi:hypothetical protein